MDFKTIQKALNKKLPFRIETINGDVYDVAHRDFIAFTSKRNTAIISIERGGSDDIVFIPLHTITSVETTAS